MNIKGATVRVDDGSFLVSDAGEITPETLDFSTGLIGTMTVGAMINAGIHTGPVTVHATAGLHPPTEPPLSDWEEVSEASVYAPRGELRVESPYSGFVEELPVLSQTGPGWYRLRAHTRGRDTAHDAVRDEPVEEYLLICWPSHPTTPLILRATDRVGLGLRRNEVQKLDAPQPPHHQPPAHLTSEEAAQKNLLKKRHHR